MSHVLDQIAAVTQELTASGSVFEIAEKDFGAQRYRYFKNAPANVRDMMERGRAFGSKTAMVFEGERWSYDDVYRQIDSLSFQLVRQLGVKKGERVAIAMRNYPEWITSFLAILYVGAVPVPLNSWGKSQELLHGVLDSGAVAVFCDVQRFNELTEVSAQFDAPLIVARPDEALEQRADVMTFARFLEGAGRLAATVEIDPDDVAMIMYSSGTTGRPKGVVWSHLNFVQTMFNYEFLGALVGRLEPARIERFVSKGFGSAWLLAVPLFHSMGLNAIALSCLLTGGKLVIMYKWNVDRALEYVAQERITVLKVAPSMTLELLDSPGFARTDTSSLLTFGPGGSAHPARLSSLIAQKCPDVMSGSGYGTTETGGAVSSIFCTAYEQYPRSSGVVGPLFDVKIVGENGQEVARGEPGEIWIRGITAARGGYWMKPEATAEAFGGGWYRSGDVGFIDAEGLLYVTDRIRDMVIRGGENIYCVEVENAIYEHPLVAEAVVFGVPHEVLGEELVAAVRAKPDSRLTAEDLRQHMSQRVAGFKVPAHVVFYSDGLPRSPMGKILKRQLRDEVTRSLGRV